MYVAIDCHIHDIHIKHTSHYVENFSQKAIYIVMKIRYNKYIDTVRNKIKENFYTTSKPDSVGLLLFNITNN